MAHTRKHDGRSLTEKVTSLFMRQPAPQSSTERRNSMESPPSFGIMLVGKDGVKTKEVGTTLLGKQAFDHFNPDVAHVLNKYIGVALASDLFASDLSEHVLRQRVKKCMSLCVLGPHALVLVADPSDFGEQQRQRMEQVMGLFSEHARKHAIVFSYKETKGKHKNIETLIQSCGGRHHLFTKKQTEALKAIEDMVSRNKYIPLTYEDGDENIQRTPAVVPISSSACSSLDAVSSENLTLVLCGNDASLKSSVADLILSLENKTGGNQQPRDEVEVSSTCVKREGNVCGHHVTLIQLPSLESCQTSEEKVWQEILECLRLSDPGVHAFLLTSQGQLTDEDKSASKRIEHYFGEAVGAFCLRVLATQSEQLEETRDAQQGRETSHLILDDTSKVEPLLERVMKMRKENGGCYTHDMYSAAQLKSHLRCHHELEKMKRLKGSKQGVEEDVKNLRIVLLGKTGEGKSASGNTILGKDVFKASRKFKSVTTICQKETVIINGRPITVIDTPGLFDTEIDNEVTKKEIVKCMGMAAPGPHVFLLVKQIGRFTEEERKAVEMIQKMFGDQSGLYTIVLLTHGDTLEGEPLDLQDIGSGMTSLLRACGMRHHVIDNKNKNNKVQVNELLSKIDSLVEVNGGRYYTNETFQEVEKALKQEQERILLEKKEEIEREKQKLQSQHQAEVEKLKNEMEEEKRRQEKEMRRREDEFRSKENSMRESLKEAKEKMEQEDIQKVKAMEEEYKRKKQENEEWIKERTKEIHSEREEWERKTREEQRRREEEEEKRRVKEIEEQRKRQESQEEEREKHNKFVQNMRDAFEEDKMRKRQEYEERAKKEKEKQDDLEEKIKHAEESKVTELEEQKRKHMEECQRNQEEEEKRMKEEKTKWSETLESKQREWKHKREEEQKRYEKEKLEEKQRKDAEEKQRKIQEEQKREKMEQDTRTKIKDTEDRITKLQQEYEQKRQEQEQMNIEREEKHRAEKEELRLQKKLFDEQMEKECKSREEEKKRNIEFLTKTHEKEKYLLNWETELAARKQAEEEFNKELDRKVNKAKTEGYNEGHKLGKEEVEAERTTLGRGIDNLYNKFSKKMKGGHSEKK